MMDLSDYSTNSAELDANFMTQVGRFIHSAQYVIFLLVTFTLSWVPYLLNLVRDSTIDNAEDVLAEVREVYMILNSIRSFDCFSNRLRNLIVI